MLCLTSAPEVWIRYRYEELPEHGSAQGALAAIKIYKDEHAAPNPTVRRGGVDDGVRAEGRRLMAGDVAVEGRRPLPDDLADRVGDAAVRDVTAASSGSASARWPRWHITVPMLRCGW